MQVGPPVEDATLIRFTFSPFWNPTRVMVNFTRFRGQRTKEWTGDSGKETLQKTFGRGNLGEGVEAALAKWRKLQLGLAERMLSMGTPGNLRICELGKNRRIQGGWIPVSPPTCSPSTAQWWLQEPTQVIKWHRTACVRIPPPPHQTCQFPGLDIVLQLK